jgi:hypothetical protein
MFVFVLVVRFGQAEHSQAARLFAFQILQHSVATTWPPDSRDAARVQIFKNAALSSLSAWAQDMDVDPKAVKANCVKFVTDVVKREWPQRSVLCGNFLSFVLRSVCDVLRTVGQSLRQL